MASPPLPDATLDLEAGAREALRAHLERTDHRRPDTGIRGALKRVIPKAAMPRLRGAATDALRPVASRQIAKAARRAPLRLHLGSGFTYKDGWVNIDQVGVRADVWWNLARGVPFADDSVDAIFHEHLFEHLPMEVGFGFTRECLRVLRPGGVLRIGVPDAGACVQSYAGNSDAGWARSAATGMLAVNLLFYENEHRAMYDGQTLALLCEAAGFAEASRLAYGEGRITPSPDSEHRRDGTLYVEAIKR